MFQKNKKGLPAVEVSFRRRVFALLLLALLLAVSDISRAQTGQTLHRLRALQQAQIVPVVNWRFHQPDIAGGEAKSADDADWQSVQIGFHWKGEKSRAWFRARITIPEVIEGFPTKGFPVRLRVGVDDDGEIYVDGQLRQKFHWDDGNITLTEHARPGQTFVVAIRGINGAADGELRYCRLTYGLLDAWQPYFDRLLLETGVLEQLGSRADVPQHATIAHALQQCEAQLDLKTFHDENVSAALASLAAARRKLQPLEPLMRQYRVTYVGHAHIDMNWLWTWPETIDVCQRTWDSALKLMNQFPDFGFVQSQPGAYVPIQKQFPAEFARMQQAGRRGQWDVVGGLWDESDTNLPSGEALVRSLFLGQRYFKQQFGRYAQTGWLPDSFGHSAQLPQLFQGVGIRNFYHERGGDGARFAWWQAPDGSRVLKANTDHYDATVEPDQLTEPWDNERRYGLKQSLVVFGVGDHGGGPTREQILKGKTFQAAPLLPQVQFLTADAFFKQLRADPAVNTLPVVDTDLQYVATGCYTTHADIKADVRGSENDLYTAEVLASLAGMRGRPYPVQGFTDAWKPTAFAQFHDILCGTAIHSTYDWMHEQLAPARRFAAKQIAQSLDALAGAVDTRGGKAGDPAVIIWNPLSFTRDDVVRVKIANASLYKSVYDRSGRRYPVQDEDSKTLVFIAQQIPGFGHAVYYLSTLPCASAPPIAQTTTDSYVLENPFVRLTLARNTGLMTGLLHKATGQQMLMPGQAGNVLQILGDGPSAWDNRFNGELQSLTGEGAVTSLDENGPVYSVVQVEHGYGNSHFTQRIMVYNQLPRIDIPTEVRWNEHEKMLKVAFPLNMAHPDCRVGIPYGSISRPHNGQENPGQKWMDVTEMSENSLASARTLNLDALLNHDSGAKFDNEGRSYPRAEFPRPGIQRVGSLQVPIHFGSHVAGQPDNIAYVGQSVVLPAEAGANTLFLVGAGAPGAQEAAITFVQADGSRIQRHVRLNDWIVEDPQSNELAVTLPYQLTPSGRNLDVKPHLWLTSVPLPKGRVIRMILPENRKMHVYAATLAQVSAPTPRFGLSVLNDSKYGSDTKGGVFRLSLLRSSSDPDPNPDEGLHTFTYSLWPHNGDSRTGESEQAGLALNIPLRCALTTQHPAAKAATPLPQTPFVTITAEGHGHNLVAGALKHSEDGQGYILRFFETQGRDTTARLTFSQPVTVQETDLLERPVLKAPHPNPSPNRSFVATRGANLESHPSRLFLTGKGNYHTQVRTLRLPVGHDKIVTLHITGMPDANQKGIHP